MKTKNEEIIMRFMDQQNKSGNTFVDQKMLEVLATELGGKDELRDTVCKLVRRKELSAESGRIYLPYNLEAEKNAAEELYEILESNTLPSGYCCNNSMLDEEQKKAVEQALNHRLSIICGGAGSGKTTVCKEIIQAIPDKSTVLLLATTGKAAVHLRQKTNFPVITVHAAVLGDEVSYSRVDWETITHILVDESSMLTIELLEKLLKRRQWNSHLILIGDPNQLPAVGAGRVMDDLMELGIPTVKLKKCYRQEDSTSALAEIVSEFPKLRKTEDLGYDESFEMITVPENSASKTACDMVVDLIQSGESVQLLSLVNSNSGAAVDAMNGVMQQMVNPPKPFEKSLSNGIETFRDGDRVLVTENLWNLGCCNGDVGTIRIYPTENTLAIAAIDFPDGRRSYFTAEAQLCSIQLGYAITVHKSQGSEYGTIILPLIEGMHYLLNHNLLYTAISRAKKRVVLIGTQKALSRAISTELPKRTSTLQERVAACWLPDFAK